MSKGIKRNYGMDKKELLERFKIDSFDVLDSLPVPVSVQNFKQVVVFENKEMKRKFGSYLKDYCFKRWLYIEGFGEKRCIDCPALVALKNKKTISIIRKTRDIKGNTLFVKITHEPLLINDEEEINYYIEVIQDVTECFVDKIRKKIDLNKLKKEIWVSLTSFGNYGGKVIASEEIPFVNEKERKNFLLEMSLYLFTAIGQGENYNEGLFGFLPVLNKKEHIVLVYAFRFTDKDLEETRLKGLDYGLLMIFTKIEHEKIIMYRKEIIEFLDGTLKFNCDKKDLTYEMIVRIKKDLVDLIELLENKRFEIIEHHQKDNR